MVRQHGWPQAAQVDCSILLQVPVHALCFALPNAGQEESPESGPEVVQDLLPPTACGPGSTSAGPWVWPPLSHGADATVSREGAVLIASLVGQQILTDGCPGPGQVLISAELPRGSMHLLIPSCGGEVVSPPVLLLMSSLAMISPRWPFLLPAWLITIPRWRRLLPARLMVSPRCFILLPARVVMNPLHLLLLIPPLLLLAQCLGSSLHILAVGRLTAPPIVGLVPNRRPPLPATEFSCPG
mmetsp:Transcript_2364/g.6868  ORF Transcript_2364/g.6868 Transcript_2364/m.6868 type:complete len:241 (-) Transcript_2364:226-948(-)